MSVDVGAHETAAYIPARVATHVREQEKRADKSRIRIKDKADRATTQLVLDPRTLRLLQKLINNNHLSHIHGCISTGKEANVYYAQNDSPQPSPPPTTATGTLQPQPASSHSPSQLQPHLTEYAIKIYKTSILVFKDRDRYVTGEFRWRRGYCKSNPRKMVRLWAEKEMRNLKRLNAAAIPSPVPVLLKSHVLVMSFIGSDGQAAPRLKDAVLSPSDMRTCYLQCIRIVRTLYHCCHLVHADLSEYNLLYHDRQLVVIDVSQAVEHDHPQALVFLKKDVMNVGRFFAVDGHVNVMDDDELLQFVLADGLSEREENEWLDRAMRKERVRRDESGASVAGGAGVGGEGSSEFVDAFVPRRLDDIVEYEREYEAMVDGRASSAMHAAIRAMTVGGPSDERKDWKDEEKEGAAADDPSDGGTKEDDDEEEDGEDGSDSSDEDVIFADSLPIVPAPSISSSLTAASARPAPLRARVNAPTGRLNEVERRQRDRSKQVRRKDDGQHDDDSSLLSLRPNAEHSSSDDDSDDDEEDDDESDDEDEDEEGSEDESTEAGEVSAERTAAVRSKAEVRAERRANKKLVKAEKAEKRKSKIKKKDKKRKVKATSGKRR